MKRSALALFSVVTISCQCGGPGNGGTGGGGAGGGTGGGGGGEAPVSIAVTPADATYTTDGVTAATAVYTATATYAGGRTEDISALATFGLVDFALGSFTGSTFTSTLAQGGRTTVRATFRGVEGNTSLTLRYQRQVTDPGSMNIPANPGTKFTGTVTPARAPDLVYPNDGVLLPPNLSRLEVHFLPGAGNTLFELSLTSTFTDVKIYLRCAQPLNGGCIYLPDPAAWTALAISNRGAAPVTLRLKGTDDTGAEVGESGELKVSFSNDALQGGLYYWTTTAKAIMRFDFASATQMTAEKFVDSAIANNPSGCVGCHALSRDGKKMVVEAEGAFDGRIAIVDVASSTTTTPFPTQNKSFFESWNPDGTRFVGVDDRGSDFNLRVFDGTTGALIESIPDTGTATRPTDHPDWSADGNTIAYSSVTREGPRGVSLQWATKGAVRIVQRPSGGTWGMPIEVAPWVSGKHRYYPAIAPSNEYLVFNESTCASGEADIECDSDTDPDARLFAAKLMPMAPLVELKRANAGGKRDGANTRLSNSFPKWSPFNFQRSVELGSRLHWVTFSSTRAYGLREPAGLTWLWMVAVDPDKVLPTDDPSYPAFCLPFQDLATSNHIAQWATVVVPPIQ